MDLGSLAHLFSLVLSKKTCHLPYLRPIEPIKIGENQYRVLSFKSKLFFLIFASNNWFIKSGTATSPGKLYCWVCYNNWKKIVWKFSSFLSIMSDGPSHILHTARIFYPCQTFNYFVGLNLRNSRLKFIVWWFVYLEKVEKFGFSQVTVNKKRNQPTCQGNWNKKQ